MASASKCWSTLPDHIVVHVFSYLPLENRYRASQVCGAWNHCFKSHYLWQSFHFEFVRSADVRFLHCVKQFGQHLRHVSINVDQSNKGNRENACAVMDGLSATDKRCLRSFSIRFSGENPLFYAGAEFISCLKTLFGPPPDSVKPRSRLTRVDLSGLMAAVDEEVLNLLSANNPELTYLNIQIKTLVCKIKPECVIRLLGRCRSLVDLRLYHSSVSDDVLLALVESDRVPLKHLAVTCRREEKYCKDLSAVAWSKLSKKLPELRVTLGFDHTCPFHKIWIIMKPEIPVSALIFETYTRIYQEVSLASDYYKDTLEKIVAHTQDSPELESALIKMSTHCKRLQSMHVFNCNLPPTVVEEILQNRPDMRTRGSYVLRTDAPPERVVVGFEGGI